MLKITYVHITTYVRVIQNSEQFYSIGISINLIIKTPLESNLPILLYCIDGVVIAAQCTATFSKSIVLPWI